MDLIPARKAIAKLTAGIQKLGAMAEVAAIGVAGTKTAWPGAETGRQLPHTARLALAVRGAASSNHDQAPRDTKISQPAVTL